MFFDRDDDFDFIKSERLLEEKNRHKWDFNNENEFKQYNKSRVNSTKNGVSAKSNSTSKVQYREIQNNSTQANSFNYPTNNSNKTKTKVSPFAFIFKFILFLITYSTVHSILDTILDGIPVPSSGLYIIIAIIMFYNICIKKPKNKKNRNRK